MASVDDILQKLKEKITVIIVSHRPSFLHWVDQVIVLSDGNVKDQGSWQQIADRDTYLKKMIEADRNWQ